ncbi:MAG: hypothetical protein Q9190_007832 [Brigantiaea leucoxantha]
MADLEGRPASSIPRLSRLPVRTTIPKHAGTIEPRLGQFGHATDSGNLNVQKSRVKPSVEAAGSEALDSSSLRGEQTRIMGGPAQATDGERKALVALSENARRPRPSLSQRATETLTQIPPSPSPRRRQSGFFPQDSPAVRPKSSLGRNRPMTSAGFYPPMSSPTKGSRSKPPPVPRLDSKASKGFESKGPSDSRMPQTSPKKQSESFSDALQAPSKPKNPRDKNSAKPGASVPFNQQLSSRTFAAGSSRSRPSILDSFREPLARPSGAAKTRDEANVIPLRGQSRSKTSMGARLKEKTAGQTVPTESQPATVSPKSSAALRETIANARAARRAAAKYEKPEPSKPKYHTFELTDIPDEPSHENVLRKRINVALTDGRLNISALGLKTFPDEVLKMYDPESVESSGVSWYESVDLVRLNAADNEISEMNRVFEDDNSESDEQVGLFRNLESLDLHGNRLTSLPLGVQHLSHLTILNLSKNSLSEPALLIEIASQMSLLRELYVAGNNLAGPLPPFDGLQNLEVLDVHSNAITSLPDEISTCPKLRCLDASNNKMKSLPTLLMLPQLKTLNLSSNCISEIDNLLGGMSAPRLATLDVSINRISRFPVLRTHLPDLVTVLANANQITEVSVEAVRGLEVFDIRGNDIRTIPPEIGLLDKAGLKRFLVGGNPMRSPKRDILEGPTPGLLAWLRGRLPADLAEEEEELNEIF